MVENRLPPCCCLLVVCLRLSLQVHLAPSHGSPTRVLKPVARHFHEVDRTPHLSIIRVPGPVPALHALIQHPVLHQQKVQPVDPLFFITKTRLDCHRPRTLPIQLPHSRTHPRGVLLLDEQKLLHLLRTFYDSCP